MQERDGVGYIVIAKVRRPGGTEAPFDPAAQADHLSVHHFLDALSLRFIWPSSVAFGSRTTSQRRKISCIGIGEACSAGDLTSDPNVHFATQLTANLGHSDVRPPFHLIYPTSDVDDGSSRHFIRTAEDLIELQ